MLNRDGVQRGTVNWLPGDALSIGYPAKGRSIVNRFFSKGSAEQSMILRVSTTQEEKVVGIFWEAILQDGGGGILL